MILSLELNTFMSLLKQFSVLMIGLAGFISSSISHVKALKNRRHTNVIYF